MPSDQSSTDRRIAFDAAHDHTISASRTRDAIGLESTVDNLQLHAQRGHPRSVMPIIDGLMLASASKNPSAIQLLMSRLETLGTEYNVSADQINGVQRACDEAFTQHYSSMYDTLEASGFKRKWSRLNVNALEAYRAPPVGQRVAHAAHAASDNDDAHARSDSVDGASTTTGVSA